jgi:HicA toxin of bacterial toxin-antitoxin,
MSSTKYGTIWPVNRALVCTLTGFDYKPEEKINETCQSRIYFPERKQMSKAEKLLQKAQRSPNNLKFDELCKLAEFYGWVFQRQSGSHHIYLNAALHPMNGGVMNFQPRQGQAKPTQIRQLLDAIELL